MTDGSVKASSSAEVTGIVGLGVVGGTLATAFADAGLDVHGYDRYLGIGSPEDLGPCSIVLVCVPTPVSEGGGYDTTEVWNAVGEAAPHLRDRTIVAVKSTVPPGTSDALAARFPHLEFASVPEFLVAADPMKTLTRPDRIVVGARSPAVGARLTDLFMTVARAAPVLSCTPTEAELVKLSSNAMLMAKVILANELADVCCRFGVPWERVQAGVGLDRRIGPDHLTVTSPGGVGGGCLPKDMDGLVAATRAAGHEPTVLVEIAELNRRIRGGGTRDLPSGTGSPESRGNGRSRSAGLPSRSSRA